MATYEIGNYSANLIYRAVLYWHDHEDPQDRPPLLELLELFAPPKAPTAAEMVEVLRNVIGNTPTDYARIKDVLTRWDAAGSPDL